MTKMMFPYSSIEIPLVLTVVCLMTTALRIGSIYKIEEGLKELTSEERLKARKQSIAPLIDEYFEWIKNQSLQTLPKGKTAEGIAYSINQEKYMRVFLKYGDVPMDNSGTCTKTVLHRSQKLAVLQYGAWCLGKRKHLQHI